MLDVTTDEWVINTPEEGAIKWWIGNAAEDGKAATVFARLKVPSTDGTCTANLALAEYRSELGAYAR